MDIQFLKIKIDKLSSKLITKEFLEQNGYKIFDFFCKNDIDNLINNGLHSNNKKNLWFQLEENRTNLKFCRNFDNRTKVYLKAFEAMEEGYNFNRILYKKVIKFLFNYI